MGSGKFATAINCIDGHAQIPVAVWMKENLKVDYVDAITEPGADKLISHGNEETLNMIKHKVMISVNAHHSSAIAVAGHHDCTGNPVSKEEHLKHIRKSIGIIKSWNLPVKVLGLWVNESWKIEVIE